MGRVVAYLGPETPIADPILGGSYSLLQQAEECPAGFGIGWFPLDEDPRPIRTRGRDALAASEHLLEPLGRYRCRAALAAVGAPRQPAELSDLQPSSDGRHLFAFEGRLERYASVFLRPLSAELSDEAFASLEGGGPGALLFALWREAMAERTGGEAMADALESVIGRVQALATEADASASIAVVATDGQGLLAVRTATHGPPPPLYTTVAADRAPVPESGRIVATEPTFPGQWEAIDPHALMIFTVESAPEPTPTPV